MGRSPSGSKRMSKRPRYKDYFQKENSYFWRFMTKSGECNIRHDAKEKTKRFLQDFFTTLVDLKWTYSLGVFLRFENLQKKSDLNLQLKFLRDNLAAFFRCLLANRSFPRRSFILQSCERNSLAEFLQSWYWRYNARQRSNKRARRIPRFLAYQFGNW